MGASLLQDDRKARRVGLALISVSLLVLGISIAFMAMRLAAHNREDPPTPFAIVVAQEPGFVFDSIPFAIERADTAAPQMRVTWGDQTVTLPVGGSEINGLPLLVANADWLSVLLIAEGATQLESVERQILAGQIPARLVVVARAPAAEYEQYKDHRYTFLELNPDATITRSEAAYRDVASDTNSWKHVAAMKVTGGLNTPSSRGVSPISYPNYAGVKAAMKAMGWTWPAFGVGAAGFLTGLILLLGSYVKRPE